MAGFTTGAAYYAAFSDSPGRLEREGSLLRDILNEVPGGRVADLACGTGLHAEFLARQGAQVDAFDLSPDMIGYAAAHHAHRAVTYRTGDMRWLAGGPWDIAVCLGNSLALLVSRDDLHATFGHVAAGLVPGGLFVCQVVNILRPENREARLRIERRTVGGVGVVAVKSLVPHGGATLLTLSYFPDTDGGGEPVAETTVLSGWTADDLCAAADSAGLAVRDLWGGFDRAPFDPETSPDVLMVAVKPTV